MKVLWCWRCQMEIPMLDKGEFVIASSLYSKVFKSFKETGKLNPDREIAFKELLDYYYKVTGFKETNYNAIMHHCISMYGPPCEKCGKPYRTPKAKLCAACGNKRYSIKSKIYRFFRLLRHSSS